MIITNVIISLFTIFLYTALGTYVLTKNPHERTNKIFALLMLAFIVWSVAAYSAGLAAGSIPPGEVLLYLKIQLSGVIMALTAFVFFGLSLTKTEKNFKNPISYLVVIPSLYILYLIWTSDLSEIEPNAFSVMAGKKQEFFIFSAVFGVAGIYLLLRHYMTSKYREREQAKLILTGTIAAVLVAIAVDIILPMFFDIYFLVFSTLAPAVMGVFIAYAVYQYGFFIRPKPEISVTSFCGTDCTLCPEYLDDKCLGCRFDKERYNNCEVYRCVVEKGYADCGDCTEIITCLKRNEKHDLCFTSKSRYDLKSGRTFIVKGNGYELFLDAVKHGAFGLIASTTHPQEIKDKYSLTTTPVVWISDRAADLGVKPTNPARLGIMLINFMKKIGNAVVLIDGIDTLTARNGFNNVLHLIQVLNNTVAITNSRLIIPTEMDGENLSRLRQGMEYLKEK